MSQERYEVRIKLATETNAPFGAGAFVIGNILLIGEQASDPLTSPDQLPFCSSKGCSGWLNKLLDAGNIPEEKLFWINALNNDHSPVNIKNLVMTLQPKVVLALGGVAQAICKKQKVEFKPFYHPQYWKRFKNKQQYALIDCLKELTYD